MWLVLGILWIVVGMLCVDCLNREDDSQDTWKSAHPATQLVVTLLAPVFFIWERIGKAIEK